MPVQGRIASEIALRAISAGDIVYIWPPYDLSFIKRAQDRGAIVIAERTNCMDQMCKDVLSRAYARRGFRLPDGWCTPEAIAREKEQMLRCDFVTAANALVAQSLRDSGVPDCRILGTSYGFDAKRLAGAIGKDRPTRIPVFAFVGLGIIRKGLDVLLEAWERADIPGKLLIAGRIDQEIRQTYASTLARPDVEELGFVEDVAGVYASADVFVFPTHEEGGPQVIYEAAACGLASVVSPMGAGRIVRDQEEGIIVDPLSVDDLSQALTKIACDEPFRRTLGRNAEDRARSFKWSDAGERLFEQFTNVVGRRRDSSADQFGL
jgi:glycosyltransferase involved in cell wall biosynthesis